MAEAHNIKLEREYIIPLRRHWFAARTYERTARAVKAIKQFIAKHMKVEDRDLHNVRLDVNFNNEVWFRGRASPPSKVKVKATKVDGIVQVTFVDSDMPKHIKFKKIKHERIHKAAEKTEAPKAKEESKTEEQKKDESEKEKSSALANQADIKQEVKADKHSNKPIKAVHPVRMALKK